MSFFEDVEVHECACEGGGFFAVAADHFAGGTGGGEVDVDADARFGVRQRLDVALGTDEFEVLVYDAALEFGVAVVVAAEVSQIKLAQAADAGRDGGFVDAVLKGELLKAGD